MGKNRKKCKHKKTVKDINYTKKVTFNESKNETFLIPEQDESRNGMVWIFAAIDRVREEEKNNDSHGTD